MTKNLYQESWEARSSVRTRPRKIIDFSQNGYFFPEDKQAIFLNQDVVNLGQKAKENILLQSLYKYLNDIINLEIKLIISACNNVIYRDLIIQYDDEKKLNAHTVIIDEYYHVYVARDMLLQLNQHFPSLKQVNYPASDAYNAVMLVKNQLDQKYHDIFEIIAVCIFETTLVRELVEFFNDENVHPSIKFYVNDHMNDEAKHYRFFFDLLCYTWKQIPQEYKDDIGSHLAGFIKLYLDMNSEKSFNLNILESLFEDKEKPSIIIQDLYKGFEITSEIPIVKNVLNILRKSKLLDNAQVKLGFLNIGLSV